MKLYLLIIISLVFAGCSKTTESTNNKKIAKIEEAAPPTPVGWNNNSASNKTTNSKIAFDPNKTSFTATELAATLNTYPDADKAYHEKTLTVTGKVLEENNTSFKFSTEPPGNAGVEDWDIIARQFLPKDEKKVSVLKPGQQVTVKCTYRGFAKNTGFGLDLCELQ